MTLFFLSEGNPNFLQTGETVVERVFLAEFVSLEEMSCGAALFSCIVVVFAIKISA